MKKNNSFQRASIMISTIFLAMLFIGCKGNNENKNDQPAAPAPRQNFLKPAASNNDSLLIHSTCAVFYNPDPLQLEKIRSVNKKEVFESMTHEYFYQMRNARMLLKKNWPQIHIIETSSARWLIFVKADKSRALIDLDSKNDISGILLFDEKKDPLLIDMMNIDTALESYFKN